MQFAISTLFYKCLSEDHFPAKIDLHLQNIHHIMMETPFLGPFFFKIRVKNQQTIELDFQKERLLQWSLDCRTTCLLLVSISVRHCCCVVL